MGDFKFGGFALEAGPRKHHDRRPDHSARRRPVEVLHVNSTELERWARLFAVFGIIFGMTYLLLGNIPDRFGQLNGLKDDLLWPSLILIAGAITAAILGVVRKAPPPGG